MAITIVCMTCKGSGKVDGHVCPVCGGRTTETVDVIPEGYREKVVMLHKLDIDKKLVMCLKTGKL